MTADLPALIARLEAAEVGSRELGRDVLVAMNIVREVDPTLFYGVGNEDTWHFGDAAEQDGYWRILPDPSTSIDAALALAERALPRHDVQITMGHGEPVEVFLAPTDKANGLSATSKTPALALCIAILRAKQGEG